MKTTFTCLALLYSLIAHSQNGYRQFYSAVQTDHWTTSGDNEYDSRETNVFYIYKISREDSLGGDWKNMGEYNVRSVPGYLSYGCRYCFYYTDSWGNKLSAGYSTPEEVVEKIIAYLEKRHPH